MTMLNGAGITEMSVTVQVLTVDGNRRMSHRFFEQIPPGTLLDDLGDLADDAHVWGYVRLDSDHIVVGARAGTLIRMDDRDAVNSVKGPIARPRTGDDRAAWDAYLTALKPVRKHAEATFDALIDELPQLYLGG